MDPWVGMLNTNLPPTKHSIYQPVPECSYGLYARRILLQLQGVQRRMVYLVIFRIFESIFVFFVVAIFDLVHDVEAIHGLC